ncbi:DoxX family protein [Nocardia sp. NPDC020380]|uniref:DoxX family protein n=1 Tax=Nocardia sp. NPDC020380 TaxID=3364309 RepID=UPI0037AF722D
MAVIGVDSETSQDIDRSGPVGWNPFTRLVFRFVFVSFGLMCLLEAQITAVFLGWPAERLAHDTVAWPARLLDPTVKWVGDHVFGVEAVNHDSGSGDQTYNWVQLWCVLMVAVVATVVWTALDRRRPDYRRLAGWFLLVIRVCLGGQMLLYGFAKLIPSQMPEPALSTLLEPYGNMNSMGVLWNQVGSSPSYEILLGAAEVTAGLLLFIPRTAMVGAMLALVDMAMVFVMDMNFDVPVKIGSGFFMLMALVLLTPEAKRLAEMLILDRRPGPSTAPYPFRTPRARRIATLVQLALAIWIAVGLAHASWGIYQQVGSGRPKPPLYGIWTVEEFTRDGQSVPPLLTDENRWQRIVFDYPGFMQYQQMDGTLVPAKLQIDTQSHHLQLQTADAPLSFHEAQPQQQPPSMGDFTFQQSAPDQLRLEGEFNGHPVTVTLHRFDENNFPLRDSGFHWVINYPSS